MLPEFEFPFAFAGVLAIRGLWNRKRPDARIRAREERARRTHREAMRAMQDALIAANAAQKTREEFLARMSHELRTPLNAVIGFSRVLESNRAGNQRPQDVELLRRVRVGGEQLLRVIEEVLDQSNIEGGQLSLELRDTDVVAIVNRVVDDYREIAANKGVQIESVLPQFVPPLALDAGRLAQVVEYLVDNAIKFTNAGVVQITLATDGASGRPSRLTVSDTGIGIPAERVHEIFEPFEQVEASCDRNYGGIGLGLPLARRLCDAMGCTVSVESTVGKGSRFTVRFPSPGRTG
jgi:signal transduction histidine kinase